MSLAELNILADYLNENGAEKEAELLNSLVKESSSEDDHVSDTNQQASNAMHAFESFLVNGHVICDNGDIGMHLPEELKDTAAKLHKAFAEAKNELHDYINNTKSASSIFGKLSKIADRLDAEGATEQADMIDEFLLKHAAKSKSKSKSDDIVESVDWQEEEDTDQSKRYDSKHHHSMQIREPKTDSEMTNLEGYKDKHHVHTYQNVKEAASTRYCPEHIGVTMGRVGEATFQCPLDGKMYNWEVGFTDYDGKHHAGGSVAAQTTDSSGVSTPHRIFDSRENILNRV